MKRVVSLLCVACLLFTLCACGAKPIVTEDNVEINTEGMTDLQKAVVITAESYALRGFRSQYDQKGMTGSASRSVGRRSTMTYKPEDYTAQRLGYHDCSSFVFDVYWAALGMDISEASNKRNTKWFMTNPHVVYEQKPETGSFASLTAEEKQAKLEELKAFLQPGDIIVYRKKGNGSGHAMLYIGNGQMVHSSGGDYSGGTENYESAGTYAYADLESTLFEPSHTRYLMKQHSYVVMRPLAKFEGEIPADTRARCDAMRGIMAEKLSSHTFGQSVSLGGEVTFTFHLENYAKADKTLTVTDTVPAYTTYVSGADKVDGSTLSWEVTVPAMGEADVSYTVKVTDDAAALGKTVKSESSISGVAVNCREIYIKNTLSEAKQGELIDAMNELLDEGELTDMALLNAAYRKIGIHTLTDTPAATVAAELMPAYNGDDRALNENHAYYSLAVPRLYGGMAYLEKTPNDQNRTRMLKAEQLVAGDIIIADDEAFLYTGSSLLNATTMQLEELKFLDMFLAYYAFTVIRPSFGA